jgi:hypothetical protein
MIRSNCILSFLLPVLILSCTGLPQADFYESEGILSIKTSSENTSKTWNEENLSLLNTLVYRNDTASGDAYLEYNIYVQTPGDYYLSALTAFLEEQNAGTLSIMVTDEEGSLIGNVTMSPPVSNLPIWIDKDRDGNEAVMLLENPGIYKLRVNHEGKSGIILDKLQLTLNNEYPPEGMGYPATRESGMDPLFAKREQPVGIPPSAAFGVIADSAVFSTVADGLPDLQLRNVLIGQPDSVFSPDQQSNRLKENFKASREGPNDRGFVLQLAEGIQSPDFKQYPALWYSGGENGFAELEQQIHLLSDPDLPSYEIPFFTPLPEWISQDSGRYENRRLSGELLTRWVQLSMLSPVMVLPFSDDEHIRILSELERDQVREAVQFRRDLYPYLYSYTLRARTSGERTVTAAESQPDAFFYGNELFVVPVSEEGLSQIPVRFPEGDWYSWWDGEEYPGGQTWLIDLSSGRMPLFVKAGSIIPKRSGGLPIQTGSNDSLVVDIFSGGVSSFRLYEDDGKTMNYRNGDITTTAFRWFEQEGEAVFTIGAMVWGSRDDYRTETRYSLRFKFVDPPQTITANGEIVPQGTGTGEWSYDESERMIIMCINQPGSRKTDVRITW